MRTAKGRPKFDPRTESIIVYRERQQSIQDLLVFALLVAIGVAGRWAQPDWCFTPIAATAIFAGFYYSRLAIAALVPLATLLISDLVLPSYDNVPVLVATYGTMGACAALGRLLHGERSRWSRLGRWMLCALLPATLFFLVTNFAVWAFQSDYPKTVAGLQQCYIRALPFFRSMLAGDVFYLIVLFTCAALAGVHVGAPERSRAR